MRPEEVTGDGNSMADSKLACARQWAFGDSHCHGCGLTKNYMDSIRISVVIPTFNRRHVLERTLPAFLAQDLPAEDYELIFGVDGSTDGTAEMLRGRKPECALRVLEFPHRGPGAVRNAGIAAAAGELILFLDDDIICSPSLLRHHCAAHPTLEPHVVHGPIYLAPESPKTLIRYCTEASYEACYRNLDPAVGLRFPLMASSLINSSMPRQTLLASGGFDERFMAQEDYELGLRLLKMGVQFHYLPAAVAYEFFAKSSRYFLKNDGETYGRTDVWLCRKHPEHRPYSELANMGKLGWRKRLRRKMIAQFPISLAFLVSLPLWGCERLCRFRVMQKAGFRLLSTGRGIVELRSKVREAGSWKALQREFGMRLPVLLYHHVGPLRPGTLPSLTVSPQRFERHVRWLARRGYAGIRTSDWVKWRREGTGLPDKPVLLTFDDGYADLADYALPLLRRYGFGAAVYIVTGQLGGTNAWDEARGSGTHRLMTPEQICYWDTQGVEFGAHTRTHANLTTLPANELTKEIVGSRDDLAKLLGSRVASFSYPYGFQNQAVQECVRGAFDLALLADDGTKSLNDLLTNPYLLRRTMVQPDDGLADLECRLRWGHSPIQEMRVRVRPRARLRSLVRTLFGSEQPKPF